MKNTVGILLFTLVIYGFAQTDSIATQIQLKTYLEKTTVPLNKEVVFYLELSWTGELSRYHIVEAGDPVVTNLELRRSGSSNRAFIDDAGNPRSVKTISYYYSPKEVGMAYIDGVVLKYEDQLTNKQESLMAKRLGAKIVGPLSDPRNCSSVVLLIIKILAVLFVLTVICFIFKYFRQKKINQIQDEDESKTLEEKFLLKLQTDIKSTELTISERTEWLSKTIADYFHQKFELAPGAGLKQVIGKLGEENIDKTLLEKMNRYLNWVDCSRFAMENPSESDLHLFIDTFEQLLNKLNNINNTGKQK